MRKAAELKAESLHIELPALATFDKYFSTEAELFQSCIEGLFYGNYEFNKYKKSEGAPKPLSISFETTKRKDLKTAIDRGQKIMTAVTFTRDLQNEPGNVLYPLK